MSDFRFEVGDEVMCNLGPSGWKLGRVIALNHREENWSEEKSAPYQVALEADHALIYVPEDDDRYCREATPEDLKIARRPDALASLPPGEEWKPSNDHSSKPGEESADSALSCQDPSADYRSGRCHCCHSCPRSWSYAELYSEHYRCAERNGLKVTRRSVELGKVRVGQSLDLPSIEELPIKEGFLQCPTLVRLPPGLHFSDDGALKGVVGFAPHREGSYEVNFVAVSTAEWDKPEVGLVRLEISFVVEGNGPPEGFDLEEFAADQQRARAEAGRWLRDLSNTWEMWERGELGHRDTCDLMLSSLGQLRALLERHPRLDRGRWWAWLGGFHMNVHKLLENTLFECELYLGYALTFGDAEVRHLAEQNLEGCYQKRQLEAARFMWNDGLKRMMRGAWLEAAELFKRAAAKEDGWGWAVNYGDIWLSEAVARLIHGAPQEPEGRNETPSFLSEVTHLLEKARTRADASGAFGDKGHPWVAEVDEALSLYKSLRQSGEDLSEWLGSLRKRTLYWCAQVLGGAPPFPPTLRPRLEEEEALTRRLPG